MANESLSDQPYFPYPRNPAMRLGFIVGDLISLAVLLLILGPVVSVFVR
jgi:hypothetical protein